MLLQTKKVAIVGGGPGGLTLARLLQMKGVDVNVYERDRDENARVQGSPLDLHDESGLAALSQANLLEEFKANFMAGADRMQIMNEKAEVFYSDHDKKPEENFGHEHFRPEIDRGVLRNILVNSLQAGTVVWDSHFLSMESHHEGWLLNFKNRASEYAHLVIAADGAHSRIRPYLTGIKAFYSGITMLEGTIVDAKTTAPAINALLRGGKIMAFGNAQNLLMGQKANGEIGFYASFKAHEAWALTNGLDYSDKTQILEWFKTAYPAWSSVWHEAFTSALTPFVPRPIYCMPFDQTWQPRANVTMLGDAAHVMPPFAGEGVNMAMWDALELSKALTSDQYGDLREAISFYEVDMRRRAASAAKASLENGERMHTSNSLQGMLDFFGGF